MLWLKSRRDQADSWIVSALLGLLVLVGLVFAFWMWLEAINAPPERWTELPCPTWRNASGRWTKGTWFTYWYVGGFLTAGLAPMGMSIHYYRKMRSALRTLAVPTADSMSSPAATTPPGQPQRTIGAQIDELHELHARGILTQQEFEARVSVLVAKTQTATSA